MPTMPTMMNLNPIRLLSLIGLCLALQAGSDAGWKRPPEGRAPEREVRAVWITTVAGLDWPTSVNPAEQRTSLARIVAHLHESGFNTIFFQVRGRGDALYRSTREPWSQVMTGRAGTDPGWDPLAFLLAEAHRRGMEVHAWFNTYLVKGGAPPPPSKPPHVMNAHPGWARRYDDQVWLDPGEPDVERHLIAVAREIVERYDIDGLQLDYIRYPGRNFDDAATYAKYGKGMPRDEWRRSNITRFVEKVGEAVREANPRVKLGVTPIGIYRNPHGVRGLESYSDVFQDTYRWIERRLVDYVAPQLYWPIGRVNGDPDFEAMAAEWREQTTGCHLYLGIGSYKPEVLEQTGRLIGISRTSGAEGHAFFRYASIAPVLPLDAYASRVLPPTMPWRDSLPPAPVAELSVATDGDVRRISWRQPSGGVDTSGFTAVYRMTGARLHETEGERLIALVSAGVTSVWDTLPANDGASWYAVTSVDRSWNESAAIIGPSTESARTAVSPPPPGILRLGTPWKASSSRLFFLPLNLAQRARVDVSVADAAGADNRGLLREEKSAGGHVVTLDLSGLAPGRYRCRVAAGGDVEMREIVIRR